TLEVLLLYPPFSCSDQHAVSMPVGWIHTRMCNFQCKSSSFQNQYLLHVYILNPENACRETPQEQSLHNPLKSPQAMRLCQYPNHSLARLITKYQAFRRELEPIIPVPFDYHQALSII